MGVCAKLFFDHAGEASTLHDRLSVNQRHLDEAIRQRDDILTHVKEELSAKLALPVRHWIQGSYKNHTLIRPVRKGGDFDLDVGLYLFADAERAGIPASTGKRKLREVLDRFCDKHGELHVVQKENCERIVAPRKYHIDFPLYYFSEMAGTCRLATDETGWIRSDPKALQDWFNNQTAPLPDDQRARLRRVLRYLKAWTKLALSAETGTIPSIALTVLVVHQYQQTETDDDSLISTIRNINAYFAVNNTIPHPVTGEDLLCLSTEERRTVNSKMSKLDSIAELASSAASETQGYLIWSVAFEHLLPPAKAYDGFDARDARLPVLTCPPRIRVRHFDKNNQLIRNEVVDEIAACRNEKLHFSVDNAPDYAGGSGVLWTVRNQGIEALLMNDLGHIAPLPISDPREELALYHGLHYMDTVVLVGNDVAGYGSIKVSVAAHERPVRNPPRKRHYRRTS